MFVLDELFNEMSSRVFFLHSALHSDKSFLIEELFNDLIVFSTLSNAWDWLITFRPILVLIFITTELEVRVLGILEDFISTLFVGITSLLARVKFTTLGMFRVIGIGENSLRVAFRVRVRAF